MMTALQAAIESVEGSVTEEVEYSYFLQINAEKLSEILDKLKEYDNHVFFEATLPTTAGRSRVRNYLGRQAQYEFTTKEKTSEKTNAEHNTEIDEVQYLSLATLSENITLRKRILIPVERDGVVLKKHDGSDLAWELDLYVSSDSYVRGQGSEALKFGCWVKIELEVDKVTVSDISKHIPIEYDTLINSDSQTAEDRATIDNLYASVYNLREVF